MKKSFFLHRSTFGNQSEWVEYPIEKFSDKRFELSNHLGNALVVVSDLLISNTGTTLSYSSEVISATDYYLLVW